MRRAIFDVVVFASLATSIPAQAASLKDELVGTWILSSLVNTSDTGVKSMSYGEHPLGSYMFDAAGHFMQVILDPDKEGVLITLYGSYTVDAGDKGYVLHVVGGSPVRFIGTDLKRELLSISDDSLETRNLNPSRGVGPAVTDWKRAK